MIDIRTKGAGAKWMDEIPDCEPVPALDHVYTYMLLELGEPHAGWLLSVGLRNIQILDISHAFGLSCSPTALTIQFINWYERNHKKPTP